MPQPKTIDQAQGDRQLPEPALERPDGDPGERGVGHAGPGQQGERGRDLGDGDTGSSGGATQRGVQGLDGGRR